MAAAIDASVLVSVGVKDAGDGDSHCHDIQQILFVVGQKGFSGVRKIVLSFIYLLKKINFLSALFLQYVICCIIIKQSSKSFIG